MIRMNEVVRNGVAATRVFGVRAAAKLHRLKATHPDRTAESAIHVPVKGLPDGLLIRPRGTDMQVVLQMFGERDYALDWCPPYKKDIQDLIQRVLISGKTPLIIDAGANIGASTILLADSFPGCHVYAIEPDPENYAMLQRNTAMRKAVTTFRQALWDKPANIAMLHPGATGWSSRVTETGEDNPTRLPGVTVPELLARDRNMVPVIVKIDIEGAEAKALATNNDWVDDVPLVIYEQHDNLWEWLGPWQGCGHAFEAMLSRRVRERLRRGENDYAFLHPAEVEKAVAIST